MLQKRACDLTVQDRALHLRQSDFGNCLSEDLLARFAANSLAIDYRRRRFIYRSNDPADALYLIARGRVKLCRIEDSTAREAVIDILSAGSLFGESALYAAEPKREKCAIAYENSRLLRIPVGDFKSGMAENSALYDYTFRLIGQRLARAERMVADFALDAIPARLEKLLLEFSKRYGVLELNGVLIDISLPHREIASIVGSTRESVTVRLNAMRREGIIDFVDRKILIKRPESLAAA
ncbi:MAG: family transcriptional regulator, cyclic receptor protein [Acidobacteriota bacterium]|jgi:CRP/FNR family transcriptional regulator|nr:family transcriptional regulator, cyclic receptor protein [Acidobacteriota bacterium]